MTRLTLHLLGPMSATVQSDERVDFGYDKVRALLAYLAAEPDRVHVRSRLASLLWPDKRESAARHSLSQALSVLRRVLDDRNATPPLLHTDRESVRFTVYADVWVDLLEYQSLLRETEQHEHDSRTSCRQCLWRLERAVQLVRGPFLEGFSLPDSEDFEDWMRARQQSVELSLGEALRDLLQGLEATGDLSRACDYGKRLIELEPWDESAHRTCMRLFAVSGRRAAAITLYETLTETLDRDLGAEPDEDTVALYERIRNGLEGPTSFDAASRPTRPVESTLPVLTTLFVGREDEVEQIRRLIESSDSRLITLVGPGGIGKTRLAVEVARSQREAFPDGVHFIPLAGVASPSLLPSAILDAISADIDRQADAGEQLISYLRRSQMLLVLDNFEHLVDGSLLVSQILEAAPGVQILVTSRERLSLTGEWVYEVEGLSIPMDPEPTSIATSGAARLFMICARKHKASFLPRSEDGPAVFRICHLTGGMPLALELAAAWIPVLSPEEIATEIEQSLDFLSSSMRDLPDRHRSIRAVLDRSWDNLTEVEQRAFRRLSVFQGGFHRAAASYVTGASLPVLSSLVSKSLLCRGAEGRYEIHELLRQYGEMNLRAEKGEVDVVRDRHRDYYIGFLSVRQEQLEGRGQQSVLAEINAEIENIRAAWQRAIATADIQGLNRAAHSSWLFYEITGKYDEGANAMSDAFHALQRLENIPDSLTREHLLAIGKLRARQSALSFRQIDSVAMLEKQEEALRILRPTGDPVEIGLVLNFLAVAAHSRADFDAEENYLLESIEHFARAGHRWGLAYSRNDLGHLRALQGDYLDARELHQSALGMLEELGDSRGIAFALRNLGIVASHLGDTDLALALLRRSVDIRRPIGNQWGIAESLKQIGVILRDADNPDAAGEHFHEALKIANDIRAMPLAREILTEYLPLLSGSDTLREGGETELAPVRPFSVKERSSDDVSRLIDAILDAGSEATSTYAST